MADDHHRRLVAMYAGAAINATIPSVLDVREGRAEVTIDINPALFHSAGALHGSVYFKALDDAAFFAANSVEWASSTLFGPDGDEVARGSGLFIAGGKRLTDVPTYIG